MASLAPPPPAGADLPAACIRAVEAAVGGSRDGTQDTRPILDHYLPLVPEGAAARAEVLGLIAPMVGAYFGEEEQTLENWVPRATLRRYLVAACRSI